MPSRSPSPPQTGDNDGIHTLDFDVNRKNPSHNDDSRPTSPTGLLREDDDLLSDVIEGVIERDRRKMKRQAKRYSSYAAGVLARYNTTMESIRNNQGLHLTPTILVSAPAPSPPSPSTATFSSRACITPNHKSTPSPSPPRWQCTCRSPSWATSATATPHVRSPCSLPFSSASATSSQPLHTKVAPLVLLGADGHRRSWCSRLYSWALERRLCLWAR